MAQTVHGNVHLTVSRTLADPRTDRVVVLQDGLVITVPQFVIMDTLAHTAHGNVHLTVRLAHVDTLTGGVLVMLVGWDIIVPKNICRKIRICPVPAFWLLGCQFPY